MRLNILLLALIISACSQKTDDRIKNLLDKKENKWFKKSTLFSDSTYIFTLTTVDTTYSIKTDKPTVIANLLHIDNDQIDTLINDSLFCRNSSWAETNEYFIEFADYNFDGVKDIVLPAGTDPRQNYGLHLYILDNKKKRIKYVEGFQKIGNPKPDTINKIITSCILSGQVFTKFYAFDSNNNIVDLGHTFTFEQNDKDSVNYEKNFAEVLKANK